MYGSTILTTLLGASTVFAAPTWPQLNSDFVNTVGRETLTDYFNLLAEKVDIAKLSTLLPTCDLSQAHLPVLSTKPLPAAAEGLVLKHVAVGRGTQNYTCDATNATAVPTQIGAVATLFNTSCIAASYPDLLHSLPKLALQFDLPFNAKQDDEKLGPTQLLVSGKHFFKNTTTPFFNLDTERDQIGEVPCSKLDSSAAPADAPKGLQGETAVPWLLLGANSDATGGLTQVFRVETAGGSAPTTCKGQPASFQVQYAAEYWFFALP
ncbi:hypothetical protein F5Y12DRAFT_755931 [Xylaria sp. FL1777]|nr:hypothetical protein F5Y12DRAFT_755931 [Xylaria sp. FL1777]